MTRQRVQMSKSQFIKHGNSTIKLSAITGVSWKRRWTKYTGVTTKVRGRLVGIGGKSYRAKVTLRVGKDATVTSYDSDALAEAAYDEIVARWESA